MATAVTIKEKSVQTVRSYLSFRLGEELFAIHVMKIMEIMEVPKITHVPHAPDFLKGVINLRGSVLPVIDARIKFGMTPVEPTINTCILVLNVSVDEELVTIGAMVDAVSEVFEADETTIQPSPSIGTKYRPEFIEGMIKENDQFMMLLNIDKVFSSNDLESVLELKDDDTLNK